MSVYSTNQNRQLYVATGKVASNGTLSTLGNVQVKKDADGAIFLLQKGHGGIVRSDLIYPKSIMWATASGPKDTAVVLKAYEVDFTADGSTGSGATAKPLSGLDYILRINFTQMYGMSDEDIYQKYGAVHATSTMSKVDFFKAMAYSLAKNFHRLYQPLVEIAIGTAVGTGTTGDAKLNKVARATKDDNGDIKLYKEDGNEITFTGGTDNVKLYIFEKSLANEWALGTKQYTPVYFKPFATTVYTEDKDEVVWGSVTDVTSTFAESVNNGYKYADLEYFCMGERADQYRNIKWPNVIPTKYLVDPTAAYYSLDIHYAYKGTCEDIQNSEKTMTIIAGSSSVITGLITDMGIGDKVHETPLFDNDNTNDPTYPTASIEERTSSLEERVTTLEG